MNKIFRKAIVLALAGSALLYVGCTKDYSGDIQTLRNEFEQYKSETNTQINTLNGQLSGLRTSVSALEKAKEQTELAIDQLKNRATALETFQENAEAQFATLEGQISGINSEISAINGRLGQIDGQIAGIYANISDLQKADEELAAAIELAKARIQALEDNTYTKQEVDGKIANLEVWANETFATKELVATIDGKLAALTGVVDAIDQRLNSVETDLNDLTNAFNDLVGVVNALGGDVDTIKGKITDILDEIENIKNDIKGVKEQLATVKETADTALAKANQALTETQAIRDDLVTNYYKAEKVDALLSSLKNSLEAQINAEVANRIAGDEKANERIDSLAKVTKAIEEDLANFKTETSEKLLELENKINEEITNRVAFQTAQEVKNAALDQKDAALEAAIAAVDAAYQAADKALNDRCDALADRCFALEGRATELENKLGALREEFNSFKTATEKALSDLRDDLNTEIQNREDADLAINQRIDALQSDLNTKYAEIKGLIADLQGAIDELDLRVSIAYLYIDYLCAAAERIQSVVFVPEYNDFRANVIKISLGQTPIKNIVSATFEVQPAEAIVYVDSLIKENAKGNAGIGLAVKELESRAVDADEVIYDVTVSILDDAEHPGRFVIEAFLDPEVFDEEIAISCVLGDYKVDNWSAGNGLQSCFVGTYVADRINLIDGYTWYDEVADEPLDDSLGVDFRIPYTDPFVDSLVFKSISEEISFRIGFNDVYKTLEDVAKALFIEVDVLTPVGVEAYWQTKDNTEQEVAENDPFELSDFAPETILNNITIPDNSDPEPKYIIDPQYVHYSTARKEVFLVNGELINPFAFVGAIITKNQVPPVTTDEVEIPWSFLHPVTVQDKYIAPEDIDPMLAVAVTGEYDGSDESFTKGDEAFVPQHGESIEFMDNPVTFNAWIFEAEDAHYVAKTERFETESDEYEFDIPFVVKQRPDDRKVEIDLGELSNYKASLSTKAFMVAVAPAFKGEEDYFIGDADEYMAFVNTDEEELEKEKIDSLYNAYDNAMDFVVDSVYVNGEKVELPVQGNPIIVDLDYHPDTRTDFSYIQIEPGFLPYGADVTVYGRYTAFEVNFDYEISFTTRVSPYTLILRPYDKYDPAKPRTIIVEGDDRIDPDLYTLKQMYYGVYLRVVDQAAWAQGVEQNPKEGDIAGADLKVRFSFSYEDFAEFDIEVDPENPGAAAEMRGFVSDGLGNPITETYEVTVETTDDKSYGWLDAAENLMWGTYNGRKVTVSAELIEDGISIQTLDEFYIETAKPIQLDASMIIDSDEFGNPLQRVSGYPLDINLTQNMIIGGILSRGVGDVPYYVADPKIFGYKDNNVAQESNEPLWVAGDLCPFYGLEMEFDWDNISGTINSYPTELNNPRDYTVNGNIITVTADNGSGSFVINIPVVLYYYLDYCGAKAERGNITISIQQLGQGN